MFVDSFIRICLSVLVSEKIRRDTVELIRDLIDFYEQDNNIMESPDISGFEKTLFGLLKWLVDYRLEHYFFDFQVLIVDLGSWKLNQYCELLKNLKKELTDDKLSAYIETIKNKKKVLEVFHNKKDFVELFEKLENGNVEQDSEVISKWRKAVAKAHENLLEIDRNETILKASQLNLSKDSYEGVFKEIDKQISGSQVIPSGFRSLDDYVFSMGGFESRRLYLIGGSSGIGKSMFLINLLVNAIKGTTEFVNDNNNKVRTFVYITAENLLDETFIRFYCCLTETPYSLLMKEFASCRHDKARLYELFNSIQNKVKSLLEAKNVNVIFKYVTSFLTSVYDIENVIVSLKEEYNLNCLYLDYLDLLCSGQKYAEYRRELASVTQQLKNLAVHFDMPIITATQLNRQGYDVKAAPSLTQISESIEKVNKADFVLFLQNTEKDIFLVGETEYRAIKATVLKHRNGTITIPFVIYSPIRNTNTKLSVFDYKFVELNDIAKTPIAANGGCLYTFDDY
mgnify:FL=1